MKQAFNTAVFGPSGAGKSYEFGHDIENAVLDKGFFVILLDPKMGDDGRYGDHRGLSSGLDFVRLHCKKDVVQHQDHNWWRKFLNNIRSTKHNGVRMTFESLQTGMSEALPGFADTMARTILSMNGKVLLAMEEAHNFAKHPSHGGSHKDIEMLIKLIDEGRNISKGVEIASQKPHKCHPSLYDSCQRYKLYPMGSTSDFDKVMEYSEHKEIIDKAVNSSIDSRLRIMFDRNSGDAELENVKGLRRRTPHVG